MGLDDRCFWIYSKGFIWFFVKINAIPTFLYVDDLVRSLSSTSPHVCQKESKSL